MAKFLVNMLGRRGMPATSTTDIGIVEDRNFLIRDFRLQNGEVMPEANIAYETYGRLAADGRNAVLVTHGYTSSHHAAGRTPRTPISRAGGTG